MKTIFNEQFNGIEIYFDKKPSQDIIAKLKQHSFKWHNQKKCWYGKATEENKIFVEQLSNGKIIPENGIGKQQHEKRITRSREEILSFYGYEVKEGYMGGVERIGKNHDTKMTAREIANRLKKDFKELYPDLRLSVKYDSWTGGSSRTLTIIGTVEQLYLPIAEIDIDNIFVGVEINGHYCRRFEDIYNICKDENKISKIKQVVYNYFVEDTHQRVSINHKKIYPDKAKQAISDAYNMVKSFEYSDINSQVDYFVCCDGGYVDVQSDKAAEKRKDCEQLCWQDYIKKYPSISEQIAKILSE